MIKSYIVETAPINIVSISNHTNGFIVYCYEDNNCVHIEHCNSEDEAEAFGIGFLNCEWNVSAYVNTFQYATTA